MRVFDMIIGRFYFAIQKSTINNDTSIIVCHYRQSSFEVGKLIEELFVADSLDAADNCMDYAIYHGVNDKPEFIW